MVISPKISISKEISSGVYFVLSFLSCSSFSFAFSSSFSGILFIELFKLCSFRLFKLNSKIQILSKLSNDYEHKECQFEFYIQNVILKLIQD